MGGRYRRADASGRPISPRARCPKCREQLLTLRWGHEERCAAFLDSQKARSLRAAFAVLVLALAFLALPAHAQGIDLGAADKLANGTVEYVLAVGCVLSWIVAGYLFKALQDIQRERHAETIEVLTSVVTLNVKMNEGLDVLEDAVELFTQEKRS